MRFVGLTGGIGAGKSEALAALERLGAAAISSDAIVHEALGSPEVRNRLVERWGDEVAPDGTVDRGAIAERVFEDREELTWLESMLHPIVAERIASWRRSLGGDTEVAVVEVPLLFESAMEELFDEVICVVAEESTRAARMRERGIADFEARSAQQLAQEEKASRADYVVTNDATLADLEGELASVLERIQESEKEGTG